MHAGKSYSFFEFLRWTRKSIYRLILLGTVPTILYEVFDLKWLTVPWPVVTLVGTATAFIVGFKNVQTYNRTWEARQIWGETMSASRSWTIMCRDFIPSTVKSKEMINRHLAWVTALRYQLRVAKKWETADKDYNREYGRHFSVPENEIPLQQELAKYIPAADQEFIQAKNNQAAQILNLQSVALSDLYARGILENFRFLQMHASLRELFHLQGKSERIKTFPFPRQYATINNIFVKIFCILLPFSLLGEFHNLDMNVDGIFKGYLVWLVIPFSVMLSWIYISLEQVGESTENPFQGGANDVPISQMSRTLEIDIKEIIGETDVPPAFPIMHDIVV